MFSVDLVDDTGEIKCTFFNESVDTYDALFQIGKVFEISKAGIKPGNPKYCRTSYEMTINRNTTIIPVDQGSNVDLKRRYSFVPAIDAIQDISTTTFVDCIGVLTEVGDVLPITSKEKKRFL